MINFQLIKKNNIKALADLAANIWHEYWLDRLSPEQLVYMIEKFQSESAIKKQIENENYKYYFINYKNKNIGYFGVSFKDDYLFLSKLYILKDYRVKGFGRKAFEKIKQLSRNSRILLTVNKYNAPTIEAYKKWGFKIIDSVVTDIGSGFVMDDYIMSYDSQCE